MSSAADQFNAVAAAPVPFAFAVIAAGVAIWAVTRWAYRVVIDKKKATLEAVQAEAKAKEAKLELTIQSLRNEVAKLAEKANRDATLQPEVAGLVKLTEKAITEARELRTANNAVSQAISGRWHPAYGAHVTGPV